MLILMLQPASSLLANAMMNLAAGAACARAGGDHSRWHDEEMQLNASCFGRQREGEQCRTSSTLSARCVSLRCRCSLHCERHSCASCAPGHTGCPTCRGGEVLAYVSQPDCMRELLRVQHSIAKVAGLSVDGAWGCELSGGYQKVRSMTAQYLAASCAMTAIHHHPMTCLV